MQLSKAILILIALTAISVNSKSVRLANFEVIFTNKQAEQDDISLQFSDIELVYEQNSDKYAFKYQRPFHSQEEKSESQEIVDTMKEYFNDISIDDHYLTFSFDSSAVTGSKMIRRGEFGDVYVLLVKDKVDATLNIMTSKGDKNADELYQIITKIVKKAEEFEKLKELYQEYLRGKN